MKKIYSFVLAAVAVLSAASCQQELTNEALENIGGGNFTVTATSAETKTALAEDGFGVVWTPGDRITVYDAGQYAYAFSTNITDKAATAVFTTDETDFVVPESIVAVYPHREDEEGTPRQFYDAKTGLINLFRVAGTQKPLAGNFDSESAGALGLSSEEDPTKVVFKNIHSLVKFTIGGDVAPKKVKLQNNAGGNIAGQYDYNLTTNTVIPGEGPEKGLPYIVMEGEFKVGETYYFVVFSRECESGLSVYFDDLLAKKTETVTVTLEQNKVYNLGELVMPEKSKDPFTLTCVAERYSDGANAWCSFIPDIINRTMASDGKYVYLQSSEADPKVYAVDVASLLAGDETPKYKTLSTTNMSGGTHAVSALRCIPNESGDPILIATNLASGENQNFNIYAYSNGTDADPVLFHPYRWDGVANLADFRRYGDRIAVTGTWQNGKIYAASQSGTKVMVFGIKDGATSADLREYCWFDAFGGGLAEAVVYPGSTEAILTTATSAGFWTKSTGGETHAGGWPKWNAGNKLSELNGAFSFQFFEFDGKKYIAYVQLPDNAHAYLRVVEDKGSLEASLSADKFFNLPLFKGDNASCTAGNTYGDCAVVTINDKLHIVAMMQGGGLRIFEVSAN